MVAAVMITDGMRQHSTKIVKKDESEAASSLHNLATTAHAHALDRSSFLDGIKHIPEDFWNGKDLDSMKSSLLHIVFAWNTYSSIIDRLRMFSVGNKKQPKCTFETDVLALTPESGALGFFRGLFF